MPKERGRIPEAGAPGQPAAPRENAVLEYLEGIDPAGSRVRFAEQFDAKSSIWNYKPHAHDCIEFLYFLEGQAEISSQDQAMATSLFELLVYPMGVRHQEFLDTRYRQSVLCVHLEAREGRKLARCFKLRDTDGNLRWVLRRICRELHARRAYHEALMKDYVRLLLDLLKRSAAELGGEKSNLAEQCLQFLQEHYQEKITMQRLAETFFVSTSYLDRVFKRAYRETPIRYLNRYRIEVARELLVQTDDKIASVARMSGFEDARSFAKTFRKLTNLNAGEYRRQNRRG